MAQRAFNYSKWDNIELSDDESDLHPNIDKESWFRMKHRARLERQEKEDQEKNVLLKFLAEEQARLNVITARLSSLNAGTAGDDAQFEDVDALNSEAAELRQKIAQQTDRIKKIDEKRSWSMEEICKVSEEKSIVNAIEPKSLKAEDYQPTGTTAASGILKPAAEDVVPVATPASSATAYGNFQPPKPPTVLPKAAAAAAAVQAGPVEPGVGPGMSPSQRDRLAVISYNDFAIEHETVLETYSEIASLDDTRDYLIKHCDILLHEHASNYLLLSCLQDEMNGLHKRMKLVCRQSQIISHIVELAQSMKRDPREVAIPFFRRLEEKVQLDGLQAAVNEFIERIKKRAVDKKREMDAEAAAERRKNGLDPFEVLESLPAPMREAFEAQDVPLLQKVLSEMDPWEAKACMKRCMDSGLWEPQDKSIFDDDHVPELEEFEDP